MSDPASRASLLLQVSPPEAPSACHRDRPAGRWRHRPVAAVAGLAALLLLSACAETAVRLPAPGADTPRAEVRAVETTGRTGRRVLGLTQGRIRACSGSYEPPTLLSPTRTTELACTGDVTGTATVGPDLLGGRSVRWQLDTGESGRTPL